MRKSRSGGIRRTPKVLRHEVAIYGFGVVVELLERLVCVLEKGAGMTPAESAKVAKEIRDLGASTRGLDAAVKANTPQEGN